MSERTEQAQSSEFMAVLAHFSAYLSRERGLGRAIRVALGEMDRRLMLGPSRVYAARRQGPFKLLVCYGMDEEFSRFADEVESGVGFTGLAAARGKLVTMPVDQLPDADRVGLLSELGIKAICAQPLYLDGALVGVLNVATRRRVGFTPLEQEFVQTLAGPMALSVAAVGLRAQLKERSQELTRYAEGLEQRVADQAGGLAEELDEVREANRRLQENMRMVIRSERNQAIAKFIIVMAHRLRNPMMAIGGFAQRLSTMLGDDERAGSYARAIVDQIDDLELMLNEVFKMQRQKDLEYNDVEPNQVLRDAYDKATAQCGAPARDPRLQLAPGLPMMLTDQDLLMSALGELIQNAIEATDGQGSVHLQTMAAGDDQVVFKIGDTGPGIGEFERGRVFDPLYTTKSLGTGLGLSLSREVVRLLGGSLELGQDPSGGLLVTVTLPFRPAAGGEPPLP